LNPKEKEERREGKREKRKGEENGTPTGKHGATE